MPKTTGQSCWEQCYKRVKEYDEDMCKAWKDEIDKLLVFAGLFSAAVTAFVVESYQWLDGSGDQTTNLLSQLISIQLNGTGSIAPVIPEPLTPTPSAIRINIYWFLSLVLSLTSVLIGILCLQWLREYERPVAMSFKDKLCYRQVRYDGLIAWKVPQIMTCLPLLLEIALILFFIGVAELLWDRNHTVAIVVIVPITCSISFLLATTFLPVFQALIIRLQNSWRVCFPTQCPYKSPLSWLVYQMILPILDWRWFHNLKTDWTALRKTPFQALWPGFDYFWVIYQTSGQLAKSIQWMRTEFKYDSLAVIPLYECIDTMDLVAASFLRVPLQEEVRNLLGDKFADPKALCSSLDPVYEMGCALLLQNAPAHHSTFQEHVIRLALHHSSFLPLLRVWWHRDIPDSQKSGGPS
ncbi:hypothetical protein BDN72DRAFT_775447 [Pluteus cervinus]|uniref:Uncharacterized protein n=1 Tax=Pluteus cervinus TaxID=181527 RepID=A0ACD3AD66_9AGAR|nr:hypothetical protein BDN72DRAFT_775447 [Pluteus cervinus]